MNRLGSPTGVLAATLLRSMADRIEAGDLFVTKFSLVDEETLTLVVEAADELAAQPTPAEAPAAAAAVPTGKRRVLARSDRCPSCGATDVRAVDDERCCLSCSFNWRPGAQVEV